MTLSRQDREAAASLLRCAADEISRFGLHRGALWPGVQDHDFLRDGPKPGPCCTGGALYKAKLSISAKLDPVPLLHEFLGRTDVGAWSDAADTDDVVQALLETAQRIEEGDL